MEKLLVSLPHPSSPKQTSLHSILFSLDLITQDQLAIAEHDSRKPGGSIEKSLVSLGFITEKTLASVISKSSGSEHIDLKKTLLDPDLVRQLPKEIAQYHRILPLSISKKGLRLAMTDIYDIVAYDQASIYFPEAVSINPVIITLSDLYQAIDTYYGYEMSLEGLFHEIEHKKPSEVGDDHTLENPTVRLVNTIILNAIKKQASDIHFQPEKEFVRLRYRLDGILTQTSVFHKSYWSSICVRIKIMSTMNIAESRKPQNGRFNYYVGNREVDFRVSSHPTPHGESIVLRILDKSYSLRSMEKLGFNDKIVKKFKNIIKRPQGLFILTGPTGSGKTTTMYSILSYLNSSEVNIMTLEDPIEYHLPQIRQSEVHEMAGTTFAEGIRSILRQDPDVIFIGEIRDEDTAKMAFRAAMTGHQVFTTLHTNDTFGIINRLNDLGISNTYLTGHVHAAVSQRLIRKLCRLCKKPKTSSNAEKEILGLKKPIKIFEAIGCTACRHTGYQGRTSIVELLAFDDTLSTMISKQTSIQNLKSYARENGFTSLRDDALKHVISGQTTLDEISRCIDL